MAHKQHVVIVFIHPFWYAVNYRTHAPVCVARKYGKLRAKVCKEGHRVVGVRQNAGFTPYP